MKKMRFYISLFAAKLCQLIMKLLGRNATYLPGKIAVAVCKDFLAYLTPPKTVIAVTGTNGKTTVSNLLSSILKENGYRVTNNSFGSNVQAGVISALIEDSNFAGKAKKDIAVLEVDERSSLLIYPYLKPDYLICNNIMRDSLKRNAHTEFIRFIINKALPATTKLILNADDLNAATLGTPEQARVFFGLDAERPKNTTLPHIRDIVYCPSCGAILESEYVRYNHIGRHYCPNCELKSPVSDYTVSAIDRDNNTFTIRHAEHEDTYHLINDNIVNVYNFAAVIAVLSELGMPFEAISKGFAQAKIVKTRFKEFNAGNTKITLLMAKGQNPIACGRCYDYVAKSTASDKCAIIIVDDKSDNCNNSENTCWLYDCDYTPLADPSIKQIIFGGPRCKDHLLRALLAGIPAERMSITESCVDTVELVDFQQCKNIYILHDLYRPDDAEAIKNGLISLVKGETYGN